MPIRFSTEAANEDKLRDDAPPRSATPGTPQAAGKPAGRPVQPAQRDSASGKGGEGKAGKDINAAAFIKDKDSDKT